MKRVTYLQTAGFLLACMLSNAQDAKEIIRKADTKMQGEESSYSVMTMTIKRPRWERSVVFKNWTKGRDYALTLVTSPPADQGQSFLKLKNEMWNWNPTINRMIKLPPSMLAQGWMGSDVSNDDILKESSMVQDYTHTLLGREKIGTVDCYKIELIPTEEAAVVWGRIVKWISSESFDQLKSEYYDEEDYLIRTEIASDIRKMDDRIIPTRFELIPADKPGNRTILILNEIKFNLPLQDSFFSQQNMSKLR